jgi:hypothetical protein
VPVSGRVQHGSRRGFHGLGQAWTAPSRPEDPVDGRRLPTRGAHPARPVGADRCARDTRTGGAADTTARALAAFQHGANRSADSDPALGSAATAPAAAARILAKEM